MSDNFLLEATLGDETVFLGRGILSTLFSVAAYGEGKTAITLEDQDTYIVNKPLAEVKKTLEYALD